jgi:hypothetical protein
VNISVMPRVNQLEEKGETIALKQVVFEIVELYIAKSIQNWFDIISKIYLI